MLKFSMIFNSYILFSYLLRREEVVQLLLLLQSSWLSRCDVVAVPVVAETDVQDSRAAAVGSFAWFPLYLLGNKELVCFLLTIIFLCYVAAFTPVIFTISTKRWHSTSCGIEIF
jgi:hypothetical protein